MIDLALALDCAPNVAPTTIAAIVRVESAGDPLAINVNTPNGPKRIRVATLREAVDAARREIAVGNTVDIGLMQINSRNLAPLGATLADAFEPCRNLELGAAILTDAYSRALAKHPEPQAALRAALSAYNTGDFHRGFRNGYVSRYDALHARRPLPAPPAPVLMASPTVYRAAAAAIPGEAPVTSIAPNTPNPIISRNERDFMTPGVQVATDPDDSAALGLVRETALSAEDAWEANADLDRAGDEHGSR